MKNNFNALKNKEISSFFNEPINDKPSDAFSQSLRESVLEKYNNSYNSEMNEVKKLNWKRIMPLGGGLFAVVIAVLFALNTTGTFNKQNETSTNNNLKGELIYSEGEIEYRKNSDEGWFIAQNETSLEEGYELRVNGEGRAIVALDDGSAVRLNDDSSIKLTSLDPNSITISNLEGEIYTRVEKLDRNFEVKTTNATFTSLGTAYKTVNTESKEGVEVYESKVKINQVDKLVEEGKAYYLKSTDTTKEDKIYELDTNQLKNDEFLQWNKLKDEELGKNTGVLGLETNVTEEKEETKEESQTNTQTKTQTQTKTETPPTQTVTGSISITYSQGFEGKFKVQWSTSNLDSSQGFKVVYNKTGNPTYPTDNPNYYGAGSTNAVISALSAGTYYVRVCRYTGSGCDSYSNQVQVTVTAPAPIVYPDTILLSFDDVNNKLNWSTGNGAKGEGFKVVWNQTGNPVYPTDNPTYTNSLWHSVSSNGYFRVCAYKSGVGCTVYSNEVQITKF